MNALEKGSPAANEAPETTTEETKSSLEAPRPFPQIPEGASLAEAALFYAEAGISVFPLPPGEKVAYRGSSGFKDATADPEQVKALWEEEPLANIGTPDFDVLDVEGPDGHEVAGFEALRKLEDEHGALPKTLTVLTPSGGRHIYLRGVELNQANHWPGIDVKRAGRGYVLLPPSSNGNGKTYQVYDRSQIAAAAFWLKAPPKQFPAKWEPAVGSRNTDMYALARALHSRGLEEESIYKQ
jgi:hypothetical protein